MNDEKPETKLVREACERLSEHFDTVQIFATRHEAGDHDGTITTAWGSGNWCARFGQVQEWCIVQDERTRQNVRKEED